MTVLFLYFWQTSVSPYFSFRSPSKSLSISPSLFFFLSLSPLPFFLYLSPLSLFLSLSLPLYLSLPPSFPHAPHSFLILLSPASHFCFSLFRWMFCLRFLHYVECHRQWCFILSLALMCVCQTPGIVEIYLFRTVCICTIDFYTYNSTWLAE